MALGPRRSLTSKLGVGFLTGLFTLSQNPCSRGLPHLRPRLSPTNLLDPSCHREAGLTYNPVLPCSVPGPPASRAGPHASPARCLWVSPPSRPPVRSATSVHSAPHTSCSLPCGLHPNTRPSLAPRPSRSVVKPRPKPHQAAQYLLHEGSPPPPTLGTWPGSLSQPHLNSSQPMGVGQDSSVHTRHKALHCVARGPLPATSPRPRALKQDPSSPPSRSTKAPPSPDTSHSPPLSLVHPNHASPQPTPETLNHLTGALTLVPPWNLPAPHSADLISNGPSPRVHALPTRSCGLTWLSLPWRSEAAAGPPTLPSGPFCGRPPGLGSARLGLCTTGCTPPL